MKRKVLLCTFVISLIMSYTAFGQTLPYFDMRYLNDFKSLYVYEDFGDGLQEANICIRRSVNVTVGYEVSL